MSGLYSMRNIELISKADIAKCIYFTIKREKLMNMDVFSGKSAILNHTSGMSFENARELISGIESFAGVMSGF